MAKREKILLGIAMVALLYFLMDRLVCSKRQKTSVAVKNKPPTEDTTLLPATKVTRGPKDAHAQFLHAKWGRNPFLGSLREPTRGSNSSKNFPLTLKAISWKEGVAYVLIDDIILKEGEERNGIRLVKVKDNQVIVQKGGKVFTLKMGR